MYFAEEREVVVRDGQLISDGPFSDSATAAPGRDDRDGPVPVPHPGLLSLHGRRRSSAATVEEIVEEMMVARTSERITRVIDHDPDGSMEQKKREGYF